MITFLYTAVDKHSCRGKLLFDVCKTNSWTLSSLLHVFWTKFSLFNLALYSSETFIAKRESSWNIFVFKCASLRTSWFVWCLAANDQKKITKQPKIIEHPLMKNPYLVDKCWLVKKTTGDPNKVGKDWAKTW